MYYGGSGSGSGSGGNGSGGLEAYFTPTACLKVQKDRVSVKQTDLFQKCHRQVPPTYSIPGGDGRRLARTFSNHNDAVLAYEQAKIFGQNNSILKIDEISQRLNHSGAAVVAFERGEYDLDQLSKMIKKNRYEIFIRVHRSCHADFTAQFVQFLRQLVLAIEDIHEKGYQHGNICSQAILVKMVYGNIMIPKLVGFGEKMSPKDEKGTQLDWKRLGKIIKKIVMSSSIGFDLQEGHEVLDLISRLRKGDLEGAKNILSHPALWEPMRKIQFISEFVNWYESNQKVTTVVHDFLEKVFLGKIWYECVDLGAYGRMIVKPDVADYLKQLRNVHAHVKDVGPQIVGTREERILYASQHLRKPCPGLLVELVKHAEELKLQTALVSEDASVSFSSISSLH